MRTGRSIALLLACAALCAVATWQAASWRRGAATSHPQVSLDENQFDPQDNRARLLLLAAGGPLLIEARLTLDGKPFRLPREALLDQLLADADTDHDGHATWEEAFANPRFAWGRFTVGAHERQSPREQTIRVFDRDRDGRIDRQEARFLLAQSFGGGSLSVQGYRETGAPATWQLLDVDGDGGLSPDELTTAADRLQSLDNDGNELLHEVELAGGEVGFKARVGVDHLLLPLGGASAAENAWRAVVLRYARDDGQISSDDWPLTGALFAQLDANRDGRLDRQEFLGLNAIEPHLQLEVGFSGEGEARLSVAPLLSEPELAGKLTTSNERRTELAYRALVLRFQANSQGPRADRAQAELTLAQLDSNRNGYVEYDELTGDYREFSTQFGLWDADGNGKVFVEEIEGFLDRQLAPQRTQVGALAGEDEDPMFALLDTDGDGQLGLREMRCAAARMMQFDHNADGRISPGEVPARLTLTFGRGPAQFDRRVTIGRVTIGRDETEFGPLTSPTTSPPWFARMDRNGDGDISPREFLGQPEQFAVFDTNRDGLLDPREASTAK